MAEPEQDGEHCYYSCPTCGYLFGFSTARLSLTAQNDGACAVGVPEDVRRAASAPMRNVLAAQGPLLTIGKVPDDRTAA